MDPFLAVSVGPYPNSALSPGQLAVIAVVPVLSLAIWLISVYLAARRPRHRELAAGTAPPPQQPRAAEPEHRAA
jgi:hypothetical protein